MWTKVSLSNMFGRVKKVHVSRSIISSSSWSAGCGSWHFFERVFIAGGDIMISTIGNSPKGLMVYHQIQDIDHILFGVLTVLVQGHCLIVFWWLCSSVVEWYIKKYQRKSSSRLDRIWSWERNESVVILYQCWSGGLYSQGHVVGLVRVQQYPWMANPTLSVCPSQEDFIPLTWNSSKTRMRFHG